MTYPTPFFETCEPVPYISLVYTLSMERLSEAAAGFGRIYSWLDQQGIEPSGPPFYRYVEFNEDGLITIEAGVPADVTDIQKNRFSTGILAEGRYVSILYTGDYSGLESITAFLMRWAEMRGLKLQFHDEGTVSHWASRLEWYLVGPDDEPDPAEWQTRVSILVE
jgi:effector-binding domain-containing protein